MGLSLLFEPTLLEVTGDYIYAAFRDCNIVAKLSRTDGRVLWMKQLNIVIKDMMVSKAFTAPLCSRDTLKAERTFGRRYVGHSQIG